MTRPKYYQVIVTCFNCRWQGEIRILLKQPVSETPCPECECAELVTGKRFWDKEVKDANKQ